MRIYISGPMSGFKDLNFPAFYKTEREIKKRMTEAFVTNPAEIGKNYTEKVYKNPIYENYLRMDLKGLLCCDVVFVLPEWEKSKGAKMEIEIAKILKMPIFENLDELEKFYFGSMKNDRG